MAYIHISDVQPFLEGKVMEALKAVGIKTIDVDSVIRAATSIQKGLKKFDRLKTNGSLVSFDKKLRHFADWGLAYGLPAELWGDIALRFPTYFRCNPETRQKNLINSVDLLAPYNVEAAEYIPVAVRHGGLAAKRPETVKNSYELLMVLLSSPYAILDGKAQSFEDYRQKWILKHPAILTLSEDNYLLRLAMAEITHHRPIVGFMETPRKDIERTVVEHLGHDPDVKEVKAYGGPYDDKKKAELKQNLRECADALRADMRARRPLTEVSVPTQSVVYSLIPYVRAMMPRENPVLLSRMIASGLIKGYSLK